MLFYLFYYYCKNVTNYYYLFTYYFVFLLVSSSFSDILLNLDLSILLLIIKESCPVYNNNKNKIIHVYYIVICLNSIK